PGAAGVLPDRLGLVGREPADALERTPARGGRGHDTHANERREPMQLVGLHGGHLAGLRNARAVPDGPATRIELAAPDSAVGRPPRSHTRLRPPRGCLFSRRRVPTCWAD